jgi:excisionase family DNA binding protein
VDTGDRLLTPGEVAALFRVDPKTVTRWAAAGRIGSIRTPGGHRRFRESEVRALLEGELGELKEEETGGQPGRAPEPNNRGGNPPSAPPSGQANPGTPGTSAAGAHVSARPRGTPGLP